VFGPRDNTFIPRIILMSRKRRFPLINDGNALVDITYIDNFVDAVRGCLKGPGDVWNETYNLSNGEPIRIRDWFRRMLAVYGKEFRPRNVPLPLARTLAGLTERAGRLPFGPKRSVMTRYSVGYMARSMTLNIHKAKRRLGYGPRLNNENSFLEYRRSLEAAKGRHET
jgi:nucleoside-diphosphate-sugar epimerase